MKLTLEEIEYLCADRHRADYFEAVMHRLKWHGVDTRYMAKRVFTWVCYTEAIVKHRGLDHEFPKSRS